MSSRRRPRSASRGVAACAVGIVLGSGCARLVVKDPAAIERASDRAWTVDATPPTAAAPPSAATPSAPAVGAAPVTPLLPFAKRPEVRQALQTPVDGHQVPSGLYALDPLLAAHRAELESRQRARRSAGGGTILLGLVLGGVAAWAISAGASRKDSPDPGVRSSATQALFWGSLGAALGAGQLVAGAAMFLSSPDPRPLRSYYRETYADAKE